MKHSAKMSLYKSIVVLDLVRIAVIICVLVLRLPNCTSKPADIYSDKIVSILISIVLICILSYCFKIDFEIISAVFSLQSFVLFFCLPNWRF